MKRKVLSVLLPCLIVLVIAVCVFSILHLNRSYDYSGDMFGKSYRGCIYLYNTSRMNATMSDEPVYCISKTGKLLVSSWSGASTASWKCIASEKTGHLRRFSLSEENFDSLLDDELWVACRDNGDAFDGKWIRENTVESWRYRSSGGEFVYLLRQQNGDVFYCFGKDTMTEIIVLQSVGNQDLFFDRIEDINA